MMHKHSKASAHVCTHHCLAVWSLHFCLQTDLSCSKQGSAVLRKFLVSCVDGLNANCFNPSMTQPRFLSLKLPCDKCWDAVFMKATCQGASMQAYAQSCAFRIKARDLAVWARCTGRKLESLGCETCRKLVSQSLSILFTSTEVTAAGTTAVSTSRLSVYTTWVPHRCKQTTHLRFFSNKGTSHL